MATVTVAPTTDAVLPSTGGMVDQSALTLNAVVPGIPLAATAEALTSSTVGSGNEASSFSSVASLNLGVGSVLVLPALSVGAGVLQSNASATCSNGVASVSGQSLIATLTINGSTFTVTGQPNQTITLPGLATIIVNEQISTTSGNTGSIDVNALDVKTISPLSSLVAAQVIVSHSHADITCATGRKPPPPPCTVKDFVTGGGWITLASGAKGTFGFVGGQKANGLQGHLTYIDHGTGLKLMGTPVTAYTGTGSSRQITYTGGSGSIVVNVTDNGNPSAGGAGVDDFAITSGSYSASGTPISHGNIVLHHPSGC